MRQRRRKPPRAGDVQGSSYVPATHWLPGARARYWLNRSRSSGGRADKRDPRRKGRSDMRVALLYPEVYDMARFKERRKEFTPFGVLYLAAVIEQAGHNVAIKKVTPMRPTLS